MPEQPLMGRRNRERVRRIRHGEESSYVEQRELDALERLSEQYDGELIGEVIQELAREGRLKDRR